MVIVRSIRGKTTELLCADQWHSQDLEVGAQGVWGTEVPQRGPGAEPLVGGS